MGKRGQGCDFPRRDNLIPTNSPLIPGPNSKSTINPKSALPNNRFLKAKFNCRGHSKSMSGHIANIINPPKSSSSLKFNGSRQTPCNPRTSYANPKSTSNPGTKESSQNLNQAQQHCLQAANKRSKLQHLYTVGSVFGIRSRIFIDSGSSVSMVALDLVHNMGWENKIQGCTVQVRSFTKDKIPIQGEISLPLSVAGQTIQQSFLVTACLNAEFLIGLDFLEKGKMCIDLLESCLRSDSGRSEFIKNPTSITRVAKLHLKDSVKISPNTISFVEGLLPGNGRDPTDRSGLLTGSVKLSKDTGVEVIDSVSYSKNRCVKVQVCNQGKEPITLDKGMLLGKFEPIVIYEGVHGVHSVNHHPEPILEPNPGSQNGGSPEQSWSEEKLWKELGLEEMDLSAEQKSELKELLWEFRSCFSLHSGDLGRCNMFQANIELKPDAQPKWIANRPIAYALRPVVDEQIKSMLASGVIEPYKGDTPWNSPIMVVRKPNSEEFRFVSDGRYVNSQTLPDTYEIPTMHRVLDELKDCNYLSSMDITCSFNQIPLSEKSRPLTAFTYQKRRYCFAMMVMGLKQSSATFCRMIDTLFGRVLGLSILFFIDDILVGAKTFGEHLDRLRFVFSKLRGANLKLKPKKCHLFRKEVSFVGYTISKEGVSIDNTRIQPILDLKPPTNRKGVQSIIGMLNFNRQFIQDFAGIIRPLYGLLKKDTPFVWSTSCQEALDALKQAMVSAPVLAIPDIDDRGKSFRVEVDSSGVAWGGILSQEIRGERRTIAYYSKCIPNYKRRQGASRLEFLGMFHALKHWKPYLMHNEVEVLTDCSALTSMETLFNRSSRVMQRQMEELADFRMKIRHKAGVEMVQADFLSRYNYESQSVSVGTQTGEHTESGICHQEVSDINSKSVESICQVSTISADSGIPHHTEFVSNSESLSEELDHLTPASRYPIWRDLEPIKEGEELEIDQHPEGHLLARVSMEGIADEEEDSIIYDQMPGEREISIITLEDIWRETLLDPVLRKVTEWLQQGDRPQSMQNYMPPKDLVALWKGFNRLSYREGIIYTKWSSLKPPFREHQIIVVPYALQERVLTYYHCGVLSIHAGVEASWNKCVRSFWWSGMRKDFKLFIGACVICHKNKPPRAYLRAPLQPMLYSNFSDCLSIDHIVPSTKNISLDGHRYILTLVDNFTNYIIAIPVKSQTAEETMRCIIKHYVLTHGVPLRISHDLHASFCSTLFTGIMKELGIHDRRTTPFFSSSNGKVERANRKINSALRAVVPPHEPDTWDRYVPYVASALNCLKSQHSGFSPNFLVYGREIRFPQKFFLDQGQEGEEEPEVLPKQTKAYQLYRRMRDTYYKVRQNAQKQAMFVKKEYDKRAKLHVFNPGDHCFVLIDGNKAKFAPRWQGPIRICKQLSVHNYIVLMDPTKKLYKVVNVSKLKPYTPNRLSPIARKPAQININPLTKRGERTE